MSDEHAHANYWVDLAQEDRHAPGRLAHLDPPSPVDLELARLRSNQAAAYQGWSRALRTLRRRQGAGMKNLALKGIDY